MDQGIVVGFDAKQRFFYVTEQKRMFHAVTVDSNSVAMAVQVDFITRCFNVKLNEKLMADYVAFSDPQVASCSQLRIHSAAYLRLDADSHYPYEVKTFIDEDFKKAPSLEN